MIISMKDLNKVIGIPDSGWESLFCEFCGNPGSKVARSAGVRTFTLSSLAKCLDHQARQMVLSFSILKFDA